MFFLLDPKHHKSLLGRSFQHVAGFCRYDLNIKPLGTFSFYLRNLINCSYLQEPLRKSSELFGTLQILGLQMDLISIGAAMSAFEADGQWQKAGAVNQQLLDMDHRFF